MKRERPFMIGVEAARKDALLVEIFVRAGDDEIAVGLDDAQPVAQPFLRIAQMLEAMRGVHEIVGFVGDAGHELRVAVLEIPDPDIAHEGEEFAIERQRIGPAADIDAIANEIAPHEVRIAHPARDGFAQFFHSCLVNWESARSSSYAFLTNEIIL